ncbi:hypothetical protein LTR08_008259 [Meristemomyces frigidus]|nr:hypothetical protein LTR08_008259 [Meristemomyces frigidus]
MEFTPINKCATTSPAVPLSTPASPVKQEGHADAEPQSVNPPKPKTPRRQYATTLKAFKFRRDTMPAYLTPEQLLVYLPEDLYYDTLWRVIGTFSRKFISETITAQCATMIDRGNITTRERVACEARAKQEGCSLAQYMKDFGDQRKPSSAGAATEAEVRAGELVESADFEGLHAMHQALAALHVGSIHSAANSYRAIYELAQVLGMEDPWYSSADIEALLARSDASTPGEEMPGLLQQSLGQVAVGGESQRIKASSIVQSLLPYLRSLADENADVKRRVAVIDRCLTKIGTDAASEPKHRTSTSSVHPASVLGLSDEELVDFFKAEAERSGDGDALGTLELLRDIHLRSDMGVREAGDLYKLFAEHDIEVPEEVVESTRVLLEAGETVPLDVVLVLLDAVGEWVEQADGEAAREVDVVLKGNMGWMMDPVLAFFEGVDGSEKG